MTTEKVKEQILAIRASGRTNMFDIKAVQRLAYKAHFYELVCYIDEHKTEYANFIMYGKTE